MFLSRILTGSALTALFLAFATFDPVQGQASDPCATAANQMLATCLQPASISVPNFLWFVSNASSPSGSAPANADQFKTQLCGAMNQLGACIFNQLGKLANTTCQSNPAVPTKIAQYMFTYDLKCANPCRFTLLDDMRKCYTDSGLAGSLFMSNKTGGAVIGTNKPDVDNFCAKKDSLLNCMQKVFSNCPDAGPMLAQADFNMQAYSKGVTILCTHVSDYMKGITCFAESTPEVDSCAQKSQQAFMQAAMEAQSKNWTQEQFVAATCKITMDQVDCDLSAWLNKKMDSCDKGSVGLRREMECNLLPQNCTILQKAHFDLVCHEDKFFAQHRLANGGDGGGNGAAASGQTGGAAGGGMEASHGLLLLAIATFLSQPYFRLTA